MDNNPYLEVLEEHHVPFELYPFQIEDVNNIAHRHDKCSGVYLHPGLGKTAVSTFIALYRKRPTICIVPPALVTQWYRWLNKIKRKDGREYKIVKYEGTPAARKKISLKDFDFMIMSMGVFKRDFERIFHEFDHSGTLILDEAHCIKNVGTDNYKKFRQMAQLNGGLLLTGTPLNNPLDGYAYVKLVSPETYKSLGQFERIHVESRDFFNNPTRFRNLDTLASNLKLFSTLRTKEDVLHDLPEAILTPIEYNLAPAHLKLYEKLAEEQLLKFPDGEKLDATNVQALIHALGQLVMGWDYFGQDDKLVAAGYDVIDTVLEEVNGSKLIIFANYRRTNAAIQKRYGCPGIWGEVSPKEKQKAWDKFIEDDSCKLITLMPVSAGVGLDGAQHVCQDVLYIEPPIAVSHFVQSMSRVHREGQKKVATIRFATALGTIQQHLVKRLSQKEDLVQPLQGSKAVLKNAIFGR